MNLLHNTRITSPAVCRTSALKKNSHVVDMQGFDGCLFIGTGSTKFAAGTSIPAKVYGSTVSTTAGTHAFADAVTIPIVAAGAGTARTILIDVYKPAANYRYLWAQVVSSTAAGYISWTAIQYNTRRPGTTNLYDSTTLAKVGLIVGGTTS